MPARRRQRLSAAEARRTAIAAQGLAVPPTDGAADGWALRRALSHVGLLQIDSVNVLQRAHYVTLFSRVGPYALDLLDDASSRAPRRLFEYWGHEASLIPVALQPLLRWRMERAHDDAWGGMRRVAIDRPALARPAGRGGARARPGPGQRRWPTSRSAASAAPGGTGPTSSAAWSSSSGAGA